MLMMLLFIFLSISTSAAVAVSVNPVQVAKLSASDDYKTASASAYFGVAISMFGNEAVVGAWGRNFQEGAAYIFSSDESGTWVETALLMASDGTLGDAFGNAVAMSVDQVVIAAAASNKVYVLNRDSASGAWTESAMLSSNSANVERSFGDSVALSNTGDVLVVGDAGDSAAYVYSKSTSGDWSLSGTLVATDEVSGSQFGLTVDISGAGDWIAVGAIDDNGGDGAAYVFGKDDSGAWAEVERLVVDYAAHASSYNFGSAVSIVSDAESGSVTVAVGARFDRSQDGSEGPLWRGAAYIYHKAAGAASFDDITKLVASDAGYGDAFGVSICLSPSGDYVVIGAHGTEGAYFFARDANGDWSELSKLVASDGEEYDTFGGAVSITDEVIFIGASSARSDIYYDKRGVVYVFGGYVPTTTSAPTEPTTSPSMLPSLSPTEPTALPTSDPTQSPEQTHPSSAISLRCFVSLYLLIMTCCM